MGRLDLGQHIGEDVGIWFESHDAGVDVDRETSFVREDVWNGGEYEREFEEFVKVLLDEGVGVQINGGLDPDRVEGPDPQLCVLVDEGGPDALPVIRWFYQVDGEQLPAHLFEVTLGDFGYTFRKVNHDFACVGVDSREGVSKGGYGDGVAFGIERSDDRAFAVFCCGRAWEFSGREVITGGQMQRQHIRWRGESVSSTTDTHISTNESKMVTTGS